MANIDAEMIWGDLVANLTWEDRDVTVGKMMSRPALRYREKVFTFFTTRFDKQGGMAFKVGEEFDADSLGLEHHEPLAPFKTKPPMRGWIHVRNTDAQMWLAVAVAALEFAREDKR